MILCDVNVLLYAFRPDTPRHEDYRAWLHEVVNGHEAFGVSPQVLCSLVRVVTHPRIFARPSVRHEALSFAEAMLQRPQCARVVPGDRHWTIFADLCAAAAATGNLVQDAWFAALAIESGCEWITTDRDFARFPGLRWRTPW